MGWHWCSWMKVVRAIKWHAVRGRRGDRRLSEEGGDLSLLCLLHILIHLVCYRDDHCLILKFHAALLEMVSLEEMVESTTIWKHFVTVLVFGWGLSIAVSDLRFIEQSAFHTAAWEPWFFWMSSSSTSRNLSLEFSVIVPHFVLLVGESLEVF